jgi:exopolysaccharide biosynthesis predicted pyruvyltransferase EpsI
MDDNRRSAASRHVAELQSLLNAGLAPLLEGIHEVVVFGFPYHRNAGDHMIWLGQLRVLKNLGIKVRGAAPLFGFDAHMVRRLPPDVAIVISGGGNFGDLWSDLQIHREQVIRSASGRRVVQFPQSLNFRYAENVDAIRDVLSDHGDVTLTWRDEPSFAAACELFPDVKSILVPDVAFALGPQSATGQPEVPILCISRKDYEGGELAALRLPDVKQADWSADPKLSSLMTRELVLTILQAEGMVGPGIGIRARMGLCTTDARITTRMARLQLSTAQVVVSDRLHASVMCTLMGKPHVIVDDRNAKISSFLNSWMAESELVTIAGSPQEAVDVARNLVEKQRVE